MGQPRSVAVIDDGTGVYFWDGRMPSGQPFGKEWVFMGLFRCEQCGRSVTIVRFAGHDYSERQLSRQKQCPGGCESEHEWLETASPITAASPAI